MYAEGEVKNIKLILTLSKNDAKYSEQQTCKILFGLKKSEGDLKVLYNSSNLSWWFPEQVSLPQYIELYRKFSRFTCLKIAVLFTGSFQAVLFFCWLKQKKGLSAN